MKKTKIILGISVLAAFLILSGYFIVWPYYQSWKIGNEYRQFEEGIIKYFKEDTYGGKTPQETYDLYITALKNNDLDLASKYFYWKKQVEQKDKLEEIKNKGELEKYISNLPKWEELKKKEILDQSSISYIWKGISEKPITVNLPKGEGEFITEIIQPGEYEKNIEFKFNNYAEIWKIYSL